MNLKVTNKICNVFIFTDPVRAYKIAKSIRNIRLKQKAKERIKANLMDMGYGKKEFANFSSEEQEKILKYLQCLEEGLLDFLEQIKKPD